MEEKYLRIVETVAVILILAIIRQIISKIVAKRLTKAHFDLARRKLTLKVLNFICVIVLLVLLAGIWGMKREQVVTYMASVLTILGIGFFAQWSLLSNITSGLILFFTHPVKLGDYVCIMDKDWQTIGQIEDITFFFLHIRDRNNHVFTISNTEVIQKMIRILTPDEYKKQTMLLRQEEERKTEELAH